MEIAIEHSTVHIYEHPVRYGVQELRLTPPNTPSQQVLDWRIEMPGIEGAAKWFDAWGNLVHLVNQTREHSDLEIRVTGLVGTSDADGIIGELPNSPTPRIFVRETPLTRADRSLSAIAASLEGKHRDQIALYHALMEAIRERVEFDAGQTDMTTSAADALKSGHGVCQDFAHIFLSVCRRLDLPARYVTGYLVVREGDVGAEAQHAWVEADVAGLGWVGFDPANGICPDDHYVRLACGLDAADAAPIRGIRRGSGTDTLSVSVSVLKQTQQ
ncbi:MAG: transglutaminase family protein [Salaquimonas sp.]|jgi:transglutaminase-like putative cysteine protease|nr:transglutaminase family protein [Salaquimonas sp.]